MVAYVVKKTASETQVGVMNGLQNTAPSPVRPRPPRLSPELNEFLHMLDALEGQAAAKDTKGNSGR